MSNKVASYVELVALVACGLSSLALGSPARAQAVQISGTSVTMTVPEGFVVSRSFTGLESAATGSSVLIAELPPEGYEQLAATFSSASAATAGLTAQGVRITRVEQLSIDGQQLPLAIGDQANKGVQYRKFIAVMGGRQVGASTVLITFNLTDASPLREPDIEALLRSVTLARAPSIDEKVARLPFKFKPVPPFHTAEVLAGTTVTLTTFDGTDPSGTKPLIAIGRASTAARPEDVPQTAESVLRNTRGFTDAKLKERKSVTFAGGAGYFIAAEADGRTILQYLRVIGDGSYVRLIARGETSAMDGVGAAVTRIADSVAISD